MKIHAYKRVTNEVVEFHTNSDFSRMHVTIDGDKKPAPWVVRGRSRDLRFARCLKIARAYQDEDGLEAYPEPENRSVIVGSVNPVESVITEYRRVEK